MKVRSYQGGPRNRTPLDIMVTKGADDFAGKRGSTYWINSDFRERAFVILEEAFQGVGGSRAHMQCLSYKEPLLSTHLRGSIVS